MKKVGTFLAAAALVAVSTQSFAKEKQQYLFAICKGSAQGVDMTFNLFSPISGQEARDGKHMWEEMAVVQTYSRKVQTKNGQMDVVFAAGVSKADVTGYTTFAALNKPGKYVINHVDALFRSVLSDPKGVALDLTYRKLLPVYDEYGKFVELKDEPTLFTGPILNSTITMKCQEQAY